MREEAEGEASLEDQKSKKGERKKEDEDEAEEGDDREGGHRYTAVGGATVGPGQIDLSVAMATTTQTSGWSISFSLANLHSPEVPLSRERQKERAHPAWQC